jgi:hypothetical protein
MQAIRISFCVLGFKCNLAAAQTPPSGMPAHLTIARRTFFDLSPPNDFPLTLVRLAA